MTVMVQRGVGHPWTAHPGWDSMLIAVPSADQMRKLLRDARDKFWKAWIEPYDDNCGNQVAVLYKPSGCTREWEDIRWQGTPRGHGHDFKVGDRVYTDYASSLKTRRVTAHTVVGITFRNACQTGVLLQVDPPPGRLARHIHDDDTEQRGLPWLDSAWFRKLEGQI